MFSALKYHAIDYLQEKVARERFSFELFSIHIPSGLYQDKNYNLNGNLADDTYRRPWTRVTPDLTQIAMDRPVLELWNKHLYTEDFLEE
ncbi:protein shortage in chiasmata 1 ortholog-like [Lacerta agilis]|uniref:protein shortage in chiasmata 1 ortholog-like n=1 Tax=Lacerta agilis TaxID=80427 RepID=UPI00141A4F14|nr:protein shortage in chiasmata 1 ortholog-like [Lacerta agilis]